MKRSGFKQKPRKALKRTPFKRSSTSSFKRSGFKKSVGDEKSSLTHLKAKNKPKKVKYKSISTLKKTLWTIVAKRIKERDNYICFTSGKKVEGANAHCGHGNPSSICGGRLRYHPKNLHCQSYYENINLGGNGRVYYQRQIERYGKEIVDKLDSLQNKYIKTDELYYRTLINLYTNGTWENIESYLENDTI